MKKMFMFLVAMVCATVSLAQSSMMATLIHQDKISTFYGTGALTAAYNAAVNGDVITLSSGTFVATNINKAIVLRGAGMGIDTVQVVEPTVITGDFEIDIADTVSGKLTIEGIYSNHTIRYKNLCNPYFLKCRLKEIVYRFTDSRLKDANFIHCRVTDGLTLNYESSALCINSVIQGAYSENSETSNFEFVNCVLIGHGAAYDIQNIRFSSFKNCLLTSRSGLQRSNIDGSCTAYNCIGFGNSEVFKKISNSTNHFVGSYADVFKTYRGASLENLDNECFELTDAAKAKYLGMDGKEVGIHGGSLPFDAVPSNPQITKCNVAAKSTADGKLSVDIQVSAVQ